MICSGSIISANAWAKHVDAYSTIHTIAVVDRVDGRKLYCKYAIASIDNADYVKIQDIARDYEGEYIDDVCLCSPSEFDALLDSGLIPRKMFVNVGSVPG